MTIEELIATAERLPLADQLYLVTSLLGKIHEAHAASTEPRYQWADLCGVAPYPLMGEDAQTWISQSRADADTHREEVLH